MSKPRRLTMPSFDGLEKLQTRLSGVLHEWRQDRSGEMIFFAVNNIWRRRADFLKLSGFDAEMLFHPLRRPGRERLAQSALACLSRVTRIAGCAQAIRDARRTDMGEAT